jgi:hypothetical protein
MLLFAFLVGSLFFSYAYGKGYEDFDKMDRHPVQLLIAPEAVDGFQALGVPFQRSLTTRQDAGVTDTCRSIDADRK